MTIRKRSSHMNSVSPSFCFRCGDEVTIDFARYYETRQLWREHVGVKSISLDIDCIHGDIHDRSCEKYLPQTKPRGLSFPCEHHQWERMGNEPETFWDNRFDGSEQDRRYSSALAMELRLSCTYPSNCENTILSRGKQSKLLFVIDIRFFDINITLI